MKLYYWTFCGGRQFSTEAGGVKLSICCRLSLFFYYHGMVVVTKSYTANNGCNKGLTDLSSPSLSLCNA